MKRDGELLAKYETLGAVPGDHCISTWNRRASPLRLLPDSDGPRRLAGFDGISGPPNRGAGVCA